MFSVHREVILRRICASAGVAADNAHAELSVGAQTVDCCSISASVSTSLYPRLYAGACGPSTIATKSASYGTQRPVIPLLPINLFGLQY